jgi:hypothetical protein
MASDLEKIFYSPAISLQPTYNKIRLVHSVKAILVLAGCFGIFFLINIPVKIPPHFENFVNFLEHPEKLLCPQVHITSPKAHRGLWDVVNVKISSPEFHAKAVDWLAGAVRVP